MIADQLTPATFHANHAREQAFFRVLADHGGQPRTILDLGCGDGSSTARLADHWPEAAVTGLDLAPANIALADAHHSHQRINYRACDYAMTPLPRFDLIVADTVLHLIDLPTREVFRKLANELPAGGRLIFSAPMACGFNRALVGMRRVLRAVRGRASDSLLTQCARIVHGQHYSAEFLRERLAYMYIIPQFFLSASLEQVLAECGLFIIGQARYPHTSVGQMKHAVWVCERR